MTTDYHIDASEELISIRVDGAPTRREFEESIAMLTETAEYHSEWPHLVDLRKATIGIDAESAAVQSATHQYRNRIKGTIAILVAPDIDPSSCANIFHLTCTIDDVEVFDDYALAIKWLVRSEIAKSIVSLGSNPETNSTQQTQESPKQIGT